MLGAGVDCVAWGDIASCSVFLVVVSGVGGGPGVKRSVKEVGGGPGVRWGVGGGSNDPMGVHGGFMEGGGKTCARKGQGKKGKTERKMSQHACIFCLCEGMFQWGFMRLLCDYMKLEFCHSLHQKQTPSANTRTLPSQ